MRTDTYNSNSIQEHILYEPGLLSITKTKTSNIVLVTEIKFKIKKLILFQLIAKATFLVFF